MFKRGATKNKSVLSDKLLVTWEGYGQRFHMVGVLTSMLRMTTTNILFLRAGCCYQNAYCIFYVHVCWLF